MHQIGEAPAPSILKELAGEAARALAHLDVDRLEMLAASCRTISHNLESAEITERRSLAAQCHDAAHEMAALASALDATRANLHVMKCASAIRSEVPEYGLGPCSVSC
jgi:hypothetical protein